MTQFTSFVAVEETVVTEGGVPRRVEVPVEMPEGMSYEGVFGKEKMEVAMDRRAYGARMMSSVVGGAVGGVISVPRQANVPQSVAPPPPPAMEMSRDKAAAPVAALIARVRTGGRPAVDEAKFVFGGKAHIKLRMASVTAADLEQLRRLGFEVTRSTGNVVVGRIAVEKLEAVVNLPSVLSADPV